MNNAKSAAREAECLAMVCRSWGKRVLLGFQEVTRPIILQMREVSKMQFVYMRDGSPSSAALQWSREDRRLITTE